MSAPEHIPMPADVGGFRIGDWLFLATAAIDGQPLDWRRRWLDLHHVEVSEVRRIRPDWAEKFMIVATAADQGDA